MEGIVKWFDVEKGYGFIESDEGVDHFVHQSSLKKVSNLKEGERVSFTQGETEKGFQARDVELVID